MYEILVYLFENCQQREVAYERERVAKKLSAAGFEHADISEALHWLARQGRAPQTRPPQLTHPTRPLHGLASPMGKKLIIAEKPSVAGDIGRALGGLTRKGTYFESNQYVLSSAVGHLLELIVPEAHDVKKAKWSFKNLPVIPPHFDLSPI